MNDLYTAAQIDDVICAACAFAIAVMLLSMLF